MYFFLVIEFFLGYKVVVVSCVGVIVQSELQGGMGRQFEEGFVGEYGYRLIVCYGVVCFIGYKVGKKSVFLVVAFVIEIRFDWEQMEFLDVEVSQVVRVGIMNFFKIMEKVGCWVQDKIQDFRIFWVFGVMGMGVYM